MLRHGAAVCVMVTLAACSSSDDGGDDDGPEPGITATAATNATDETGTTASFTVVLDARPSATVTVTVTSDDTDEVVVQDGASLSFTPTDWNVPQTVTLAGVDDRLVDGQVNVIITATANASGGYDGEQVTVTVANADDGKEMWPSKDNTLYEHTMNPAEWSNGAGQYMFAGEIGANAVAPLGVLRRALIAFDVASVVPANATITSASLFLTASQIQSGAADVALHRLLMDWGEGASDAPGNEAGGADGANLPDAEPNEATWTHRMHNVAQWANVAGGDPGADFEAAASATRSVGGAGTYEWTGATLVSDVQSMLDNPAANFGWMVIGQEGTSQSVKRFFTRETAAEANRPLLIIDYTTP